jgi:transcriptional regulator
MYRPRAFAVNEVAVLRKFMQDRSFATIAVAAADRVHFAYAPVVLDGEGRGRARFHLARQNPVCTLVDGALVQFSFLGDDAYISPDWYESKALVPTWNYSVVEAGGIAKKLDRTALRELLVDLSAQHEARLSPKPPWLIDKVPEPRIEAMLTAIEGFEVPLDRLEGKFKLSQDKSEADQTGAITGLQTRGDARSMAVATRMKNCHPRRM